MQTSVYRWITALVVLSMFLSAAVPAQAHSPAAPLAATTVLWTETFDGSTLPSNWTITGTPGWSLNNPGGRTNRAGGTGNFAIADSDKAGSVPMDTALITPTLDLSSYTSATLKFKTYFYKYMPADRGDVDVSSDNGTTWTNKWFKLGENFSGQVSIDLPIAAAVKVRFNYTGANYSWYWQVDDVNVEVTSAAALPPSAPSALAVTSIASNQVGLKWNDNSSDETGFKLEWSADGSSGWTQVGIFDANATSGADGTITCGQTRFYRISAVSGAGSSTPSASVTATTTACPPPGPSAPSGLSAALNGSAVNLTWTDASNNETGFKVQWSANGASDWTELARAAANATTASDSAIACGTKRYYRLIATNDSGDSVPSNIADATTAPCPPPAPAAPSALSAALSGTSANLTWADNSANETGFKVERSEDGGANWAQITLTVANTVNYSDSGLTCNKRYAYRVRATNASGDSPFGAASEILTSPCTPKPTSLAETFDGGSLPVGWSITPATGAAAWAFNDPGARTNKTTSSGGFAVIDSDKAGRVAVDAELRTPALDLSGNSVVKLVFKQHFYSYATSTADVDFSLDGGTSWSNIVRQTGATVSGEKSVFAPGAVGKDNVIFRFRYYNANFAWYWQVDEVKVLSVDQASPPLAPSNAVVNLAANTASVTWTDNSSNETNFAIERTTNGGTSWTEAGRVGVNASLFGDSNLTCGTTLSYRIRALAGTLASDYVSTPSVTTPACPVMSSTVNEMFEGTSQNWVMPAGWTQQPGYWVYLTDIYSAQIGSTGKAAVLVSSSSYVVALLSPLLDLSSLNAVNLSFKALYSCYPCDQGEGKVEVSKDNGVTWIKVWGVTASGKYNVSLDISPAAGGQRQVLIKFSQSKQYLVIDDVKVEALTAPATPTNLEFSQSVDGIFLGWSGDGVSKYKVERSPDGATWAQIATVEDGSSQYVDRTVQPNTSYQYRISAYNGAGASATSTPVTVLVNEIGVRHVNVTISLYQGAPINTAAERAKYEQIINYFADGLYEMSNGVERLGKVTIYRDKANFDRANIQWIPECWPNAFISGYLTPGRRVEMCDVFPNGGRSPVNFLLDPVNGGNTIAHEWGHNFFGLFDEYAGEAATSPSLSGPLSTDIPAQLAIMNNQWYAKTDLRWLNFSTATNYSARTAQGRVFGASGWDTITRPPSQDAYVAGYGTRLYWPELAAVKPGAGQLPVIDLTQPGAQAKARENVQIVWTPAFVGGASPASEQGILAVANGVVRQVVVDTSNFVSSSALTEIKSALTAMIDQMPAGDDIGMIAYDGTASEIFPLTPVNSQADRDALILKVNALSSGTDASSPGAALQAAYDSLTAASVPSDASRVVYWITAGKATTGSNPVTLVDKFIDQNIPLWIYGFSAADGEEANLRQLAEMTVGSYTAVRDRATLQKAFEQADHDTSLAQDTLLASDEYNVDKGSSVDQTIVVDATLGQVDFELTYDGAADALNLTVTEPDGTPHAVLPANDCESSGSGVDESTSCSLSYVNPAAGDWKISSDAAAGDTYFMYYVSGAAPDGQSTYNVSLTFPTGDVATYPQPIRVEATIKQDFPIAGLNVVGYVYDPDGDGTEITFRDDGVAPDGIANDGTYSAYAPYASDGDHLITVQFDNAAGTGYYTDAGMMTEEHQTLPGVTENFERYAEAQTSVDGWQIDDHADFIDDDTAPLTILNLDNAVSYGTIDFAGDVDLFKITAPDTLAGPYALRINRLGLGMDPYLYIYAADGSWEFERYLDFTPDSGDVLFVPLDLQPGQVVYIEVSHYDDTATSGVYAISAGKYQATDAVAASIKAGQHSQYLPSVRR